MITEDLPKKWIPVSPFKNFGWNGENTDPLVTLSEKEVVGLLVAAWMNGNASDTDIRPRIIKLLRGEPVEYAIALAEKDNRAMNLARHLGFTMEERLPCDP